jgi:hypothetical protein
MTRAALTVSDISQKTKAELHSLTELQVGTGLLNIILNNCATVALALDAVACGDRMYTSDMVFSDPYVEGGFVVFEYDEDHWHRSRFEKDVYKTHEQLRMPGVSRVLRIRRGGRSLRPAVSDPRYHELCINSTRLTDIVREACSVMGLEHDAFTAERGIELGAAAHVRMNKDAEAHFEMIKRKCGRRAAHTVLKTGGVVTRLWREEWVKGLLRFHGFIGHRYFRTALCGGVAARLGDEAFFEGLARLAQMVGGPEHLRTVMCDGVAARLGDEAFFEGLARLAQMVGGPEHLRNALC